MAGFKKRADIRAGKTPDGEVASFGNLKSIGNETTVDNLPLPVQDFIKRQTEEWRRCRTNLK